MGEDLDDLSLLEHPVDPDDPRSAGAEALHGLLGLPSDLRRVGCARAQHELRRWGDVLGRPQQVDQALLTGDPAHEHHRRFHRIDAVLLQSAGPRVWAVLIRVDAVVDDVNPRGVDRRIAAEDITAHLRRHRDDGVGPLDGGPLAEARRGVATGAELFGLPRPQRLKAVGRHHVRDAIQELGQVAGEVRVPRVAVGDPRALHPSSHRQVDGHRLERPGVRRRPGKLGPRLIAQHPGTARRCRRAPMAEAANLERDALGQLPREVVDVHPSPTVDGGRVLPSQDDNGEGGGIHRARLFDAGGGDGKPSGGPFGGPNVVNRPSMSADA